MKRMCDREFRVMGGRVSTVGWKSDQLVTYALLRDLMFSLKVSHHNK